ncbi:MAG: PKD domain-containing protein, partial [bacterium]
MKILFFISLLFFTCKLVYTQCAVNFDYIIGENNSTSFSPQFTGDFDYYSWNFGDGTTKSFNIPMNYEHIYPDKAEYKACLVIIDTVGKAPGTSGYILQDKSSSAHFLTSGNDVFLKSTSKIYLLPNKVENHRLIGVQVDSVYSNRVIRVIGDITVFPGKSFEDVYNIDDNPYDYDIYKGYNSEYDLYILPLTGSTGNWPYSDGKHTWIYVENRDHNIKKGDFLNIFYNNSTQFTNVFLPKVDQELVDKGDTLAIQMILGNGNDIQIKRNEEDGNDRLQDLSSNKTDEANINLNVGDGLKTFSMK